MRHTSIMLLVAVAVVSVVACGGLSSKQRTAASEAVAALRKLHAATEVGVNYQQYGILVIEAKDKVNNANAVLPDGELKQRLNAAMDAYTDAGKAWAAKITTGDMLTPNTEPGATFVSKYGLQPRKLWPNDPKSTVMYLSEDEAMQAAWGAAMGHLLLAQKQLEEQ